MDINLKQLGAWLIETGLIEKSFKDFTETEITEFCEQIHLATVYQEYRPPYLAEGVLVIPMDSHPCHHYWAGGQSIIEILEDLHAPEDVKKRYVADWELEAMADKGRTNF